jgi:hypothetical protein
LILDSIGFAAQRPDESPPCEHPAQRYFRRCSDPVKIHGCQDVRDGDAVPENLRAMFSGFGK